MNRIPFIEAYFEAYFSSQSLAYIITTTGDLDTLEEMQQEVVALAQSDPDTAAYLQTLLDKRRGE